MMLMTALATDCVPGPVLGALMHELTESYNNLRSTYCYHLCFTDEEMEVQRG